MWHFAGKGRGLTRTKVHRINTNQNFIELKTEESFKKGRAGFDKKVSRLSKDPSKFVKRSDFGMDWAMCTYCGLFLTMEEENWKFRR
jgi:hypothetical protein